MNNSNEQSKGTESVASMVLQKPPKKYKLRNLAILPSWECDVVCHHCVFSSSPSKKGRLPIELAVLAVKSALEISDIESVTVSGGEAFLDFDYLCELAEFIAKVELKFRVVTNCSFGENQELAELRLSQLKSIGLDTVGISWDSFHDKFIDPARVRNVIRACRKLGVSIRMTSVVSRDSTLAAALELLGDEAFELPITQVKCLPVGRAEVKLESTALLPPSIGDVGRSCRSDFDTVSITPNGDVFPCCAVGGFTDGIKLGRFPDESLQSLLERRHTELKWVILASQGPKYFTNEMTEEERFLLRLDGAAIHDCVTCHRIFRTKIGVEVANRAVAKLTSNATEIISSLSSSLELKFK